MEPQEARDALRRTKLAELSPRYSPFLHVVIPPLWGGSVIAACVVLVEELRWVELLVIPAMLVLANAFEWRIHRNALHKRWFVMPALYDRHTPIHHRVYIHDDMELRDWRELALILIPPWAGVPLFFALLPIAAALWFGMTPNVALLFMATCMFYVVTYELLHLSYHLPRASRVGRNAVIRALARHHSIHHDPRFMQRWNMNVTVPLWDIVRRTRLTERAVPLASTDIPSKIPSQNEASAPAASPVIQ